MKPQPRWMVRLRPGDVIVAASGLERVVRGVSFWKKHAKARMHFVEVVICHCSRFHKPTTLLDQSQLVQGGYRPKRVRVSMRTAMDRRVNAYVAAPYNAKPALDCCDVRGVR